jgi:hypothetical protein
LTICIESPPIKTPSNSSYHTIGGCVQLASTAASSAVTEPSDQITRTRGLAIKRLVRDRDGDFAIRPQRSAAYDDDRRRSMYSTAAASDYPQLACSEPSSQVVVRKSQIVPSLARLEPKSDQPSILNPGLRILRQQRWLRPNEHAVGEFWQRKHIAISQSIHLEGVLVHHHHSIRFVREEFNSRSSSVEAIDTSVGIELEKGLAIDPKLQESHIRYV